ncbi:MAG: hypothetical protein EZS28_015040 [Streblomastix strix]|uniref:SPRY domain-containing protein n=1 Tax=Streblomastix strix TaxID=222440 RepID=A0A5J4W3E1_9EUKA|nr:MAG: hypothetical protein EZS28_015040 [Streblomastix strix]
MHKTRSQLSRKQEELNRKQEEELRQVKELNEKQKVEIEKWKPKLPQDIAFTTTSVDPADFVSAAQGNGQIKITKQQNKYNNISFGPALENGIYAIEASFKYSGNGAGIGIVRDTYSIPDNCAPWSTQDQKYAQHVALYADAYASGYMYYKGTSKSGNTAYNNESQIIRAEFNSNTGTLIFSYNGTQQPVHITGIKEKVRFMIHFYNANYYFIIRSFKKLAEPTTVPVDNQYAVQW